MRRIPGYINSISEKVAIVTKPFVKSKIGILFQSIVLFGPFTFIPTIYTAWTASNIDSLRTSTWPLMIVVNSSGFLLVVHEGNWRMRLVSVIWIITMTLVYLATVIR